MTVALKNFIYKKFAVNVSLSGGRNRMGKITVAHRGSKCAIKRKYINIDLQHSLVNLDYVLVQIRSVPRRSGYAGLVLYKNGLFSYILAEKTSIIGSIGSVDIYKGLKSGDNVKLLHISEGVSIYNLELKPGYGGQVGRAAGTSIKFLNRFLSKYNKVLVKFRSGDQYFIHIDCVATLGACSNTNHWSRQLGSAGNKRRFLGFRSKVRGVAMNPIDHPHGGNTPGGKPCMTPKGLLTKGVKTRKNKISKRVIFKRRERRIDCIVKVKNYAK